MYQGWFSGRKTRKDTTWSVPIVFPGCPVSCITVIQWYGIFPVLSPLSCENNVHRKQKFLEKQESFAPMAATMIYYVVLCN